jgi:hypothetical protein
MIINGLEIDTDIVTFLDVYAEVIHEKNILISAKDKFLNNTREKNEANLLKMKEIGTQIKQEKEIRDWKTTLITKKKAPRYV